MYNAKHIAKEFCCLDCNICTSCISEYYMITHKLWKKINPKIDGMLCIGCLEKRLKRKLKPKDFLKCPLNEANKQYKGFASRLLKKRILGK